jgi:hypothetical protein
MAATDPVTEWTGFIPLRRSGDSSMPPETNDTELLREAWAALSSASDELIRFHKASMPVVAGQPGHDEWERCGCEVATTVRDMKIVEQKLYVELEGRGVFA